MYQVSVKITYCTVSNVKINTCTVCTYVHIPGDYILQYLTWIYLHVYIVPLSSKHQTSFFLLCERPRANCHKFKKETYVRYRLSPWPYSFPVEKRLQSVVYKFIENRCLYLYITGVQIKYFIKTLIGYWFSLNFNKWLQTWDGHDFKADRLW